MVDLSLPRETSEEGRGDAVLVAVAHSIKEESYCIKALKVARSLTALRSLSLKCDRQNVRSEMLLTSRRRTSERARGRTRMHFARNSFNGRTDADGRMMDISIAQPINPSELSRTTPRTNACYWTPSASVLPRLHESVFPLM